MKGKAHAEWKRNWAPEETPHRKKRHQPASYENNATRGPCRTRHRKGYRQWYQGGEIAQQSKAEQEDRDGDDISQR